MPEEKTGTAGDEGATDGDLNGVKRASRNPVARVRARVRAHRNVWHRNRTLKILLNQQFQQSLDMNAELRRLRALELRDVPSAAAAYDYVFIVTYGRSGSTLLQGILNSSPGVLIRGENAGMVTLLWRYHRRGMRNRARNNWAPPLSPRHPWFGSDFYPEDIALRLMRDLVFQTLLRPDPGVRVLGFKDIMWPEDKRELNEYVDFLRQVFPGARFIVNTRDLEATSRSGWWARQPDAKQRLEAMHSLVVELAERLGPDAYRIHYDDYVKNVENLAGLFAWLGVAFNQAAVESTMAMKHSYANRQSPTE